MGKKPNRSFVFVLARWQHRTDGLAAIAGCMFWQGFDIPKSKISPYPGGQGPRSNNVSLDPTSLPAKQHLNPSNGLSTNMTDDRRTDRQTTLASKSVVLSLLRVWALRAHWDAIVTARAAATTTTKHDHQALLKAKYCPRVAAVSHTPKNTRKPM